MNPKPGIGTPDLKVSGDFYSNISLKKSNTDFEFNNKAKHAKFLEPKYKDIYGLEPKTNKKFIQETFYPEYMDKIKKQLEI